MQPFDEDNICKKWRVRIAFGVSPNGKKKKKEEGRKKRGCCSRVKMMSACENVTFESGRLCDRRAEDVGSPFSSSDEKKKEKKKDRCSCYK